MTQKPNITKKDGRARNGAKPGSNNGGGRRAQNPTDYKPTKATIAKRERAADVFSDKDVDLAHKTILAGAQGKATQTQLSAANMILDRKFGRPAQEHIFVGDDKKAPIRVDSGVLKNTPTEDLVKAAGAILAARAAIQRPEEGGE